MATERYVLKMYPAGMLLFLDIISVIFINFLFSFLYKKLRNERIIIFTDLFGIFYKKIQHNNKVLECLMNFPIEPYWTCSLTIYIYYIFLIIYTYVIKEKI